MVITLEQGEAFLEADLTNAANTVNRLVTNHITQNQADALMDFVFNVGSTNFANSHLLLFVNQGHFDAAEDQFEVWDKAHVDGRVMEIDGLLRRRQAEAKLFGQVG
jgi:lysozyme